MSKQNFNLKNVLFFVGEYLNRYLVGSMKRAMPLVFLCCFPIYGYCESGAVPIGSFDQFDIYLGEQSRLSSTLDTGLYKAQNEKLIAKLIIKNSKAPEPLEVSICSDKEGKSISPFYEVFYLVPWYKDANLFKTVFHNKDEARELVEELLIKDPDLIGLDCQNKTHKIRVRQGNSICYFLSEDFEILGKSGKHGRVPHDAYRYLINDGKYNKPINIKNEQTLYIFERVLNNAEEIFVDLKKADGEHRTLRIPIKIMPYAISDPSVAAGIYYRGLFSSERPTLSSERKTEQQLRHEFQDMLNKGIAYPTVYIYGEYQQYMDIRNEYAFPRDKIFIIDGKIVDFLKKQNWSGFRKRIQALKSDPVFKDFKRLYFYLIDEPDRKKYEFIIGKAEPILRETNAGVFLAGRAENLEHAVIENAVYVVAYEPSSEIAEKFHKKGAQVYSYANPQIGVYAPDELRWNYGIKILANDYDGIMPYAYQDSRGSQWSDFDSKYRDHMLTYPTSDGLLNTIHGVALQNAITDLRYAATYYQATQDFADKCGGEKSLSVLANEASEKNLDSLRLQFATEISKIYQAIEECGHEIH